MPHYPDDINKREKLTPASRPSILSLLRGSFEVAQRAIIEYQYRKLGIAATEEAIRIGLAYTLESRWSAQHKANLAREHLSQHELAPLANVQLAIINVGKRLAKEEGTNYRSFRNGLYIHSIPIGDVAYIFAIGDNAHGLRSAGFFTEDQQSAEPGDIFRPRDDRLGYRLFISPPQGELEQNAIGRDDLFHSEMLGTAVFRGSPCELEEGLMSTLRAYDFKYEDMTYAQLLQQGYNVFDAHYNGPRIKPDPGAP